MKPRVFLAVLIISLGQASSALADQRLSDLLLQMQRLQQEVQQLRGQVELQQHEISTLKRQQREQYMDLDGRLQGRSAAPPETLGSDRRKLIGSGSFKPLDGGKERSAPTAGGSGMPASSAATLGEQEAYRIAFDLLKERRYDDAVRAFEDLLTRFPNGEFADNARYWLGETYYVQRDYSAALTQFQRVLASHPLSAKVPSARLKIGYIHYEKHDWKRARAALQDVSRKYPDTTEARLAESRLDRMAREGH
jgi:tol-pal system protein YbgF